MTERLYYRDPAMLTFKATVLETGSMNGKFFTILDRSAFYPTSGGQLHDTGTINDVAIEEVIERGSQILHLSRTPVKTVDRFVTGQIDKERRTVNRQLHSAQHILSAVIVQVLGLETLSVHLGEDYGAVEVGASEINEHDLKTVEKQANQAVTENLPIIIHFVTAAEAAALPLRKPPAREGQIRVIQIGELDWSACGGTHCHASSEIGLIKITGTEKMRGRTLITFLAGSLALNDYEARYESTQKLGKLLTCGLADLYPKVEKLHEENKSLRSEVTRLQTALLPAHVARLSSLAQKFGKTKLVAQTEPDFDPKLLNNLATQVSQNINGLVILHDGERAIISAGSTAVSANALAQILTKELGLRGGGNQSLAQIGGVDNEMFQQLIVRAQRYLEES